jgi:hypothetical protein
VFERYSPRHLLEVIHPTQRERFETGQLLASTLPDGSRLV